MLFIVKSFVLMVVMSVVYAYKSLNHGNFMSKAVISKTLLRNIPLELTGQLDPKKSWDVKLIFRGEEKVIIWLYNLFILHSMYIRGY